MPEISRQNRLAFGKAVARLFAAVAVVVGCPLFALAQEQAAAGAVEGRVFVKGIRQPVARAMVRIEGLALAAVTDEQGRFRFDGVPAGEFVLSVQADDLPKSEQKIAVKAGATTAVKCYVTNTEADGGEVVVTAKRDADEMSQRAISREELSGVPGANDDVIRVLENLPGVAMAGLVGGYTDGLVIRGTGPADSKYFLNGFEMPQLFHLGALVSVVNAEMVKDIDYYPGGFGVNYAGALGGIVDVKTRSPRTDRFGGVADLSTYSSYVLLEGPMGPNFAGGGAVRKSFIEFVEPLLIPKQEADFTLTPRFYDYIAQFEYRPDGKNLLAFTFLGSDDQAGVLGKLSANEPYAPDALDEHIGWHSGTAAWDFTPNGATSNHLAAHFMVYDNQVNFGPEQGIAATVLYPAMWEEFCIRPDRWNHLKLGVQAEAADFATHGNITQPPTEGRPSFSWTNADLTQFHEASLTWETDAYAEDEIAPAKWVGLIPGVRVNYLDRLHQATADPRLLVGFFPTEKSEIKAYAGIYHQWPTDDQMLKHLGNPALKAEAAYQEGLGFAYDFGEGWSLDLEGYYKYLARLVTPTPPGAEAPYENTGRGYVYGAELLARKKLTDRLFGWVAYTYSVSKRQDYPGAEWRYFDQDQTHNFIVLASYIFGAQRLWKLGGRWQYSTGMPYTKIDGAIYNSETDSYLPLYSRHIDGVRKPPFHQLDIRLDKRWVFNTWLFDAYLDLQDVYWYQYPFGYEYNFNYTQRREISYPTFIPTVGAEFRF